MFSILILLSIISTTIQVQLDTIDYFESEDYQHLVQSLDPDLEVGKVIKDDLDLDGQDEIILGLGSFDTSENKMAYEKIYVLNETKEIIGHIESDWSLYDLKLVKMQGSDVKYIYLELSNRINRGGFSLYKVSQDKLTYVGGSPNPGGSGIAELMDSDQDGYFDSYKEFLWSYSALYYEIDNIYEWDKDKFELRDRHVYVRRYPLKKEEVVLHFISLNHLNMNKSQALKDRFLEIGQPATHTISKISRQHILNHHLKIHETFSVHLEDNHVIIKGPEANPYTYDFEMAYIDQKWRIVTINEKKETTN